MRRQHLIYNSQLRDAVSGVKRGEAGFQDVHGEHVVRREGSVARNGPEVDTTTSDRDRPSVSQQGTADKGPVAHLPLSAHTQNDESQASPGTGSGSMGAWMQAWQQLGQADDDGGSDVLARAAALQREAQAHCQRRIADATSAAEAAGHPAQNGTTGSGDGAPQTAQAAGSSLLAAAAAAGSEADMMDDDADALDLAVPFLHSSASQPSQPTSPRPDSPVSTPAGNGVPQERDAAAMDHDPDDLSIPPSIPPTADDVPPTAAAPMTHNASSASGAAPDARLGVSDLASRLQPGSESPPLTLSDSRPRTDRRGDIDPIPDSLQSDWHAGGGTDCKGNDGTHDDNSQTDAYDEPTQLETQAESQDETQLVPEVAGQPQGATDGQARGGVSGKVAAAVVSDTQQTTQLETPHASPAVPPRSVAPSSDNGHADAADASGEVSDASTEADSVCAGMDDAQVVRVALRRASRVARVRGNTPPMPPTPPSVQPANEDMPNTQPYEDAGPADGAGASNTGTGGSQGGARSGSGESGQGSGDTGGNTAGDTGGGSGGNTGGGADGGDSSGDTGNGVGQGGDGNEVAVDATVQAPAAATGAMDAAASSPAGDDSQVTDANEAETQYWDDFQLVPQSAVRYPAMSLCDECPSRV